MNIQHSHTISSEGYHQPYVRTGYETVIANRTSEKFAYTAKQDGKVISKTDNGIIIEYVDGTKQGVTLGRIYGKAEGAIYPHDIISPLDVNNKFVKGDVIAYNTGFFEPDLFDKKKIVLKSSMTVTTALYEGYQTADDASTISQKLSAKLKSKTTKLKSITVDFNQNLLEVVKPGTAVTPKDVLLIIEDEITSGNNTFDSASLIELKKLANQAPKAKYQGTVDRIEVFYNGSKSDMSPSLKLLADRSDRVMAEIAKATNKPVITGQVTDEYRVSGTPLTMDKAEIKFYITIETPAGNGDKGVFANQLKSIFSEVMDYDIHTESGIPIDAIFSYRAIGARITLSPFIIGTTTTLLKLISQKAVQIYRS